MGVCDGGQVVLIEWSGWRGLGVLDDVGWWGVGGVVGDDGRRRGAGGDRGRGGLDVGCDICCERM